jgi:hypothetical protein
MTTPPDDERAAAEPENAAGADVTRLPVAFRKSIEEGPYLLHSVGHVPVKCFHTHGFLVDERLSEVTCRACQARLNPMWVLQQLAAQETRWHQFFARYQDEMARLQARQRTRCRHCGKMTAVSQA